MRTRTFATVAPRGLPMETVARIQDESSWQIEKLVAELSSGMVGVAFEDLAGAIDDSLRRIGEDLDLDQVTLVDMTDRVAGEKARDWTNPALLPLDVVTDTEPLKTLVQSLDIGKDPIVLDRIGDHLRVGPRSVPEEETESPQLKSALVMPVTISGEFTCILALGTIRHYRTWTESVVEQLRLLAQILTAARHRHDQELALRQSRAEIARLTIRLDGEGHEPSKHRPTARTFDEIVGDSPALRAALARLQEVASSDTTVLLLGETGTGKELFARALHAGSPRRQFPLVSVNCAALPPTLIESELFGHERGAFTGATTQRQGRFELAHRGTLFLDEIGDLPLDLQSKLLRVLQEGEFERLGASRTRKVDVRIVAATHRDLDEEVAEGTFREDLYYRLNVFPIRLPRLRERRSDIPALVWYLIHKRQVDMHRWIKRVPDDVMERLQQHSWPGNIRELENVIERALIHSTGDTLVLLDEDIETPADAAPEDATLEAVERTHIEEILRECGGRINGRGNAAERLGMHPNTLRFRMKRLGIVRPRRAIGSTRPSPARVR
jgi:formate hydrogenlyase transcriptional activator